MIRLEVELMAKAYKLSDQELLACARLCQQEQGTATGAAAEMSLALNLYERNTSRYSSVYDYMRNSGWFANAAYYMDNGRCSGAVLNAVSDVLAGNRTLPEYIDEHDCTSDIISISTGNKHNRSDYIPNKTVIKNNSGAIYTFYCFPDEWSDPFGYTSRPAVSKQSSPVESAVSWMIRLAEDDSHGYDQRYRWGERGDYDCSSAVITAFQQAGIPVKDNGATYTGDMRRAFLKTGFEDVTAEVNLYNGAGLIRGDVLLNEAHHTALYIGEGMEAEASINEQGGAVGGEPGDQTGKEILIRPFRNYPWDRVLRYRSTQEKMIVRSKQVKVTVPYIQKGDTGAMVTLIQTALNLIGGYGLDVDGEFGPDTDRAVRGYQDGLGIQASGICGATTFKAIMDEVAKRTYVS